MGVQWIRIATNVFDNKKIRQIETLPEGDTIIVIWFKLLVLAGNVNSDGFIYFTKEIPYTEQMLAAYFNRPLATVQLALNIFEAYGMIELIDNVFYISNWQEYQNVDGLEKIREQTKKRVAKWRENQKAELLESNVTCNVTSNADVTQGNAIEKEIELELDKDIEIDKKNKNKNKKFIKPSLQEIKNYIETNNFSVDAQYFLDYYESNGWKVGKNSMKDWKATIRNWERREKPKGNKKEAYDQMLKEWAESDD